MNKDLVPSVPSEENTGPKVNIEVQKAKIRAKYEEAFINMMSNEKYIDISFYSFIIAKSRVIMDPNTETAGVSFTNFQYNLVVGRKFLEWTLLERMAVLVHECRHQLGGHVFRKGERDHELFNIAADIAINQTIKNLPEGVTNPETGKREGGALYPQDFILKTGGHFPLDRTAEQYYEMLLEEKKDQEKEKKDCDNPCDFKPGNGNPDLTNMDKVPLTLDDHGVWAQSEDMAELARSMTEDAVKEAVRIVDRGNLPGDIENLLALLKRKPKVSWHKVLKRYMASKTGSRTSTIKRKNRRFPGRNDLRGTKTQRTQHTVAVGLDTSGSMSDQEILDAMVEIMDLVKNNTKELKLIQIDTEIKDIEIFNSKTASFTRRGYGGTYMGAIVPFMKQEKLNPDVLIMISDMGIEDVSKDSNWKSCKFPVLWLSTTGLIPAWSKGLKNHSIIDINNR